MNDRCTTCGRPLISDEIGLSKKLVNRGTERFWCITCLARHYEVPEEALRQKIEEFRSAGCTLFEPNIPKEK